MLADAPGLWAGSDPESWLAGGTGSATVALTPVYAALQVSARPGTVVTAVNERGHAQAGSCSGNIFIDPVKPFKDLFQIFLIHANALILHGDPGHFQVVDDHRFDIPDAHRAVFVGIFVGIGNDIQQGLTGLSKVNSAMLRRNIDAWHRPFVRR